jgi:hypothetical protein
MNVGQAEEEKGREMLGSAIAARWLSVRFRMVLLSLPKRAGDGLAYRRSTVT